ncbi:MAG: hypothetical protein OSJ58_11230, partial [Dysosmobacter sp.]|nr:hypothetical protein [Dysosmobacter sp.]
MSNKANPAKVMDDVASVGGNMILKTDGTLLCIEDKTSFETFLSLGPVHIRPNTHLSGKFCR